MREIRSAKFRGKRKDNGEWVYGDLLNHWECRISDYCGGNPVDPSTVGQYTGLKDKDGVEIYEGDIIRDDTGRIGLVEFILEHASFLVLTKNEETGGQCYQILESGNGVGLVKSEVIGNIHDNPELLEGGESK